MCSPRTTLLLATLLLVRLCTGSSASTHCSADTAPPPCLATLGLHLSRSACDKGYDKNDRWFHESSSGGRSCAVHEPASDTERIAGYEIR